MGSRQAALNLCAGLLCIGYAAVTVAAEPSVLIEGVSERGVPTIVRPRLDRVEADAGAVDTLGLRRPASGRLVRWQGGGGAFLVWTFRATVQHDGMTASFALRATRPDAGGLRCALGASTRWTRSGDGMEIPPAGATVLAPAVLSRESFVFQLAMPILDTDAPGVRTPGVRYLVDVQGSSPVPMAMPRRQSR